MAYDKAGAGLIVSTRRIVQKVVSLIFAFLEIKFTKFVGQTDAE
jgi:hypothetical protein